MNVDIQIIDHKDQRYESSGDWYWSEDDETLHVRISKMSSEHFEFCAGLHEMIEAYLCRFMGISQKEVDDFDIPYEAAHQAGAQTYPCGCRNEPYSNPGEDYHAPYLKAHLIAEAAESIVAKRLGVDWKEYDAQAEKPTPKGMG